MSILIARLSFLSHYQSIHCTLECPYCMVDPVAKKELSLDSGDMEFPPGYSQSRKTLETKNLNLNQARGDANQRCLVIL